MVLKCTNDTKFFWVDGKYKAVFIHYFRFESNKGYLHSQAHLLHYLAVIGLNKSNVECEISLEEAEGMRTELYGKHHCRLHAIFDVKHIAYLSGN